jgi:hypothetical protein
MRTMLFGIVLAIGLCAAAQTSKITARQARNHIGEVQTVCGRVASTRYAPRSKGQPTFLNLDEPYPNEIFTIVIWGDDRSKFSTPESEYRDANVCARGKITRHRGTPEIVATEPNQIILQE